MQKPKVGDVVACRCGCDLEPIIITSIDWLDGEVFGLSVVDKAPIASVFLNDLEVLKSHVLTRAFQGFYD